MLVNQAPNDHEIGGELSPRDHIMELSNRNEERNSVMKQKALMEPFAAISWVVDGEGTWVYLKIDWLTSVCPISDSLSSTSGRTQLKPQTVA
jgi:hypothetical protein